MSRKRHVDYIPEYAANLTPVIPHDATLSPNSKIDPLSRGKVPGQKKLDGTWYGGWKKMGDATLERARVWDGMGAFIGFRTGRGESPTVNAVDVDLTVREDAERVLAIAVDMWSKKLAVRRVDHPDHTKLLICVRVEGPPPESFDAEILQSDGTRGKIQFIGQNRYFSVHGTHNRRFKPYIWDRDPADFPLTVVSPVELQSFWDRIEREFKTAPIVRPHGAHQVIGEPERCTAEELEFFLDHIPNNDDFTDYRKFIAMGSAIHGASGGADWGRTMWLAWCEQTDQEQEEKPETFWDTMLKSRIGADVLRYWANKRAPFEMAARAFADPPIEEVEPELVEEADEDAELAKSFLEDWCLVGGIEFYELPPSPLVRPMGLIAFGMSHAVNEKAIRRALGGDKRMSLGRVFARRSQNTFKGAVHEPGRSRIVVEDDLSFLNLWSPPKRPWKGKPIDPAVIAFYRELALFVFADPEIVQIWELWHAWMLQNPGKAPGWHWIVQGETGIGKDLLLEPMRGAHGYDYYPATPELLAERFNDYAEKHLISVSEMEASGRDEVYSKLKLITSGLKTVMVRKIRQSPYRARNVCGMVIYSNVRHPFKMPATDRRFKVVANFDVERRTPEYYVKARALFDMHWAMIGEHLQTLPISAADELLMTSNAPVSEAKIEMAEQSAERVLLDIIGEIESDQPSPGYLPIATTGDIKGWLEKELSRQEIPHRFELLDLLYRVGARPLNPHPKKPKRAEPIAGSRLWRIAKTWTDQKGVAWDIEAATPARLAKLYSDRSMPPMTKDDFTVVDEDEV